MIKSYLQVNGIISVHGKHFKTGAFGYLTPYQCKGKPKGRAGCRLCSCCRNWSEHSVRVYIQLLTRIRFVLYGQTNRSYICRVLVCAKEWKWVLNTAYPSGSNTPTHACRKIPRAKAQEIKCI